MKSLKIEIENRFTIIADRAEAGRSLPPFASALDSHEPGKISMLSSTDAQPYIACNYDAEGNFAGGRSLTESYLEKLLSQARAKGWTISEVEAIE